MSTNKGRKSDGRPGSPKKPQSSRTPAAGKKPTASKRPPRAEKPFEAKRDERTERPRKPAGDKPFRSERDERPRSSDRPARDERTERPRKPAGDKPFRSERDERPRSSDRPARDERTERPRKPEGDKPFRSDRDERPRFSDRPARDERTERPRKPAGDKPFRSDRDERPRFSDRPARDERTERPRKPAGDKPFRSDRDERPRFSDRPAREERTERPRKPAGDKPFSSDRDERPRFSDRPARDERTERPRKPAGDKPFRDEKKPFAKKPYEKREGNTRSDSKPGDYKPRTEGKSGYQHPEKPYKNFRKVKGRNAEDLENNDGSMRLNRVLSTAGIASRRDADALITAGLVMVNGKVVTELGTKVFDTDDVRYNGERIRAERKVYIVMNKPKGFITTVEDEKARKTVMELMAGKVSERVYPVGRLDRGTTGVLMFTNDGDLAKKLTHPSHGARKIYQVSLDKPLTAAHLRDIKAGVVLEDGVVPVDDVSFVEDKSKTNVGLELHVGRNRIVRRLFEQLGYEVVKLDRVNFAGLTKKNLSRGQWRHLTAQELNYLKMLK